MHILSNTLGGNREGSFHRHDSARFFVLWIIAIVFLAGCRSHRDEVIVYTALDREFSEEIFADFTNETGIHVRAKYDTEAGKTVVLTNLLLSERDRPRCDVFWNNEILNTIRLKSAGLLTPCNPSNARHYPTSYRDSEQYWFGFAARARVLVINKNLVPPAQRPTSIEALADTKWQRKAAIAKPLFGTTATHAACLYSIWGRNRAHQFFEQVRRNAQIFPGNKQVAMAVSTGKAHLGLTDTDDAMVAIESGYPIEIIYPDQAESQMGTLFIPNTLALVKNGPNTENGKKLIDYLLRPETEAKLAAGPSAQIPLNTANEKKVPARVATPNDIKAMSIDFSAAAAAWEDAATDLRQIFAEGS